VAVSGLRSRNPYFVQLLVIANVVFPFVFASRLRMIFRSAFRVIHVLECIRSLHFLRLLSGGSVSRDFADRTR
jgi:hypothetical protein